MQFGEINEPSSRAVWNCDSDDEGEFTELEWSKKCEVPANINDLIIFEGKLAVDFAKNCYITENPSGFLSGANVSIYNLPDGLVICACDGCYEELGGRIAILLEPWIIKAKRIIGVQTVARTKYLGSCSNEPFLLNSLHTSKVKENERYGEPLNQPNMLTGVAAGVLSYCQHNDLSASAWCLFTSASPYGTDSLSTKPINDLMSTLEIPLLKSFKYKPAISSNLYM